VSAILTLNCKAELISSDRTLLALVLYRYMDALLALFIPLLVAYLVVRVLPMRPFASPGTLVAPISPGAAFIHHTSPVALSSILRVLPSFSSSQSWTLFPAMPRPSLPRAQMRLLRDIGYEEKLKRGRQCGEANARVVGWIGDVVRAQLSEQPPSRPWSWWRELWGSGDDDLSDVGRIREALRHIVRDWSEEGRKEREKVFAPILDALALLGPGTRRILIPGCGLGRLAYEVARMDATWEVTAIEMSPYMNIVRRVILPPDGPSIDGQHTMYPYSWWWSHQRNTENLFRPVSFPDTKPTRMPNLEFEEGDFLQHRDDSFLSPLAPDPLAIALPSPPFSPFSRGYDTIVTLFFIDALPNVVRTISQIYSLLRPGGVWINLGPLLYGVGGKADQRVELTLDEVVGVAEAVGFEFKRVDGDRKTRTIECEYTCDDRAMMHWLYQAEHWVAHKV
jgi:SAM-dependent methyltransferase